MAGYNSESITKFSIIEVKVQRSSDDCPKTLRGKRSADNDENNVDVISQHMTVFDIDDGTGGTFKGFSDFIPLSIRLVISEMGVLNASTSRASRRRLLLVRLA